MNHPKYHNPAIKETETPKQKLKCFKFGCQEEAIFRVGTLKHLRVYCPKHYAQYIRKHPDNRGGIY